MADTNVTTGLSVQQWDDKFFTEYLGENRFKAYMGTGTSSMIQVKEDLTKKSGDSVTFALVNKLTGAGVTGSSTLEGNEESMDSRSFRVYVDKLRNAVRVAEIDEQYSAISLRNASRDVLKDWAMEKMRTDIITALGAINGVAYGSASEAQKDAWIADNSDRVLFGASLSNTNATDHSASLLTVDPAADVITADSVALLKRIAATASPRIRPIRKKGQDKDYFVLFVPSLVMRDLKDDATIKSANREAWSGAKTEALELNGGDLIYDGVYIKEIPEIDILSAVGNAGSDVAPVYLCGAQALACAWAKRTKSVTEIFDYGDKHGVAIEEIRGIEKMIFGSGATDTADTKDHGVVTGFFSVTAD